MLMQNVYAYELSSYCFDVMELRVRSLILASDMVIQPVTYIVRADRKLLSSSDISDPGFTSHVK